MSKSKGICPKTDAVELSALTHALNHIRTQDPQNVQALLALEHKLDADRSRYLKTWAESVSRLKIQLQGLKLEVRNDFAMELRDAQYYRGNMFDMEAKISEIKDLIKGELRSLVKEEMELYKELQLTGRRVDEWGRPLHPSLFKPVAASAYRVTHVSEDKSDPLGEFQRFLADSGGHYGGWEEQDHLLFLRERRKFNGKPKFVAAVQAILPDINIAEIEAHEEWYKKYELLKDLRRERIRKWRESKTLSCEAPPPRQETAPEREDKPRSVAYQRDIAERIKEWKRQQQARKAEQEERERREQESAAEERARKREAQKAKRLAVEQYKAEKIIKIQNELLASQKVKELKAIEERARKNLLLRAFREQDQEYIERIRALRAQSATRVAAERPSTAKANAERDPRRHLQPTQVWTQHCAKQDDQSRAAAAAAAKIMDLQTIPHLAVPSWRKGLSNV